MPSTLGKVAIGLSVPVGLYAVVIGVLLTPYMQRFALYAHKFNTLFLQDIDDTEQFGFAKNQVTPFHLKTPDGETLYAWHVLPDDVYARNDRAIRDAKRPHGPVDDFTKTEAFRSLKSQPARVVVSFHGNAGHIAQGWRPDTFRYMVSQPNTHVVTIDYRGFGKSTGTPTEAGLITDGIALVDWVLQTANIHPENILILGQSLGTAVSSAVALHYADPGNALVLAPKAEQEATEKQPLLPRTPPTTFAGVVLVAPFSSIPSLLLTYRIGGIIPILAPLRPFPQIGRWVTSYVVDQWHTAERLAAYHAALRDEPKLLRGEGGLHMGSLQIFHALNDRDISYHQTEMICRRMLPGRQCIDGSKGPAVLEVREPSVRFETLGYGGHNKVVTYSPISIAVMRAFEGRFE